jgi:hypothetical protein
LLKGFFPEFFQVFFPAWAVRFDFPGVDWLELEVLTDPPRGERRSRASTAPRERFRFRKLPGARHDVRVTQARQTMVCVGVPLRRIGGRGTVSHLSRRKGASAFNKLDRRCAGRYA